MKQDLLIWKKRAWNACRRRSEDAIEEFAKDGFIRQVLGEHIFTKYLEAKDKEWREFRAKVTDWEVKEYLYKY